jgi:two-component system phosphate regulon sensor histidine kinase PhoR
MKKKRRLVWYLFPSYLLITVLSLVAVNWYATDALHRFYLDQTRQDLQARAQLLKKQIFSLLTPLDSEVVNAICKELGQESATRITVILPDGTVIGDSRDNPRFMDNHADRQEVSVALGGDTGNSMRYSNTLHQRMMYVAIPLVQDDRVAAVIRTSVSVSSLDETMNSIRFKIALGVLVIAMLAAGVSYYVSRRISRPIEKIREGAQHFSAGDLAHRLPSFGAEEMAGLSEALNRMAVQLDDRLKTVIRQRNELEAVLSSMLEGVAAVDQNELIIRMNQAAGRMFDCDPSLATGRPIQEVIRNLALQRFVARSLSSGKAVEDDFIVYRSGERVLNVRCSPLFDASNRQIGSLLVMNDVTQLRHLENVRSDFVANVSHEIKTPLTAIKGFVETLQQGSVDQPEEQEKFLDIVLRHVNRLNAILEDLLSLSRIEQGKDQKEIQLASGSIKEVIQTAVQVCQPKAAAKNIEVKLDCPDEITIRIDATLLEQALVNLIDNAIKYSDQDSTVQIRTGRQDAEVLIHITDQGPGIHRRHLPRLFERFYRIDKARSRKLGGTGLGLAIVKHIIQAHGGHVAVDSTIGKGSTFTIHLPAG